MRVIWMLAVLLVGHLRTSRKRGRHVEKTHGSWSLNNPFDSKRIRDLKGGLTARNKKVGDDEKARAAAKGRKIAGPKLHPNADIPADYLKKHPNLANLGPVRITEKDAPLVKQHAAELALVPAPVGKRVADAGIKDIHLGNRAMPDLDTNQKHKGQRPRGWPRGMTWDKVPGAYNPETGSITAGKGQHGSDSLVLHEYGHALDDVLGASSSPYFRNLQKNLYDKLDPYFRQGGKKGKAGSSELFAEGFAATLKDRERAKTRFSPELVEFMDLLMKGIAERE